MIKLEAKRFELNFLLKLSDLKSNLSLALSYLNPALNNPGLDSRSGGLGSSPDWVMAKTLHPHSASLKPEKINNYQQTVKGNLTKCLGGGTGENL